MIASRNKAQYSIHTHSILKTLFPWSEIKAYQHFKVSYCLPCLLKQMNLIFLPRASCHTQLYPHHLQLATLFPWCLCKEVHSRHFAHRRQFWGKINDYNITQEKNVHQRNLPFIWKINKHQKLFLSHLSFMLRVLSSPSELWSGVARIPFRHRPFCLMLSTTSSSESDLGAYSSVRWYSLKSSGTPALLNTSSTTWHNSGPTPSPGTRVAVVRPSGLLTGTAWGEEFGEAR